MIERFLHASWWPDVFFAINWVVIILGVIAWQKNPHKNWRFFAAGIIVGGGWFANILIRTKLHLGTGPLFVTDFVSAGLFYFLSIPAMAKNGKITQHDWAAFGCIFYIAMATLELLGFVQQYEYEGQHLLRGLLVAFWFLVLIGFMRGFSKIAVGLYLVVTTIFVLLSIFAYALALNSITLIFECYLAWIIGRAVSLKNVSGSARR